MFTEAQFTAAMERAVASRGGDYRFPRQTERPDYYTEEGVPRYSTEGGESACLIGVALAELGKPVDWQYPGSALGILSGRVPYKVLYAARAAQIHQDQRRNWGESLAVYKAALTLGVEPSWFGDQSWYYQAVALATGVESPSDPPTSIAKEIMKVTAELKAFSTAMNSITISFDAIPEPTFSMISGMKPTINFGTIHTTTPVSATLVASQKDHALVA